MPRDVPTEPKVLPALVPYDSTWPDQFEAAAADIKRIGNPCWVVEHIGSTSVPGLAAKPVIDIAVRVDDEQDFERHRAGLEQNGWRSGSAVQTHPVMLLERGGTRTHIAHFFESAAWGEVNQRIFRDWLLAHPLDVRRYAEAKRLAAEAAVAGRASYNSAKTAIVQEIVDRARAERGLPLVAVSDK